MGRKLISNMANSTYNMGTGLIMYFPFTRRVNKRPSFNNPRCLVTALSVFGLTKLYIDIEKKSN